MLTVAVPFMSARRCIISVLATHPIAHRLACLPHVHQSRGRLRLLALTTGVLVPICSTVNPPHPFRPHSPRLIDTGNGENDGADYSRAWCGRSVCLSLRLCGIGGRRRLRLSYGCFELLARHLTIAGQYSGGQCGSSSGRVSIRLDRFPAYFVSPAALYPFARFPPRCPVPSHPCPSNPVLFVPSP